MDRGLVFPSFLVGASAASHCEIWLGFGWIFTRVGSTLTRESILVQLLTLQIKKFTEYQVSRSKPKRCGVLSDNINYVGIFILAKKKTVGGFIILKYRRDLHWPVKASGSSLRMSKQSGALGLQLGQRPPHRCPWVLSLVTWSRSKNKQKHCALDPQRQAPFLLQFRCRALCWPSLTSWALWRGSASVPCIITEQVLKGESGVERRWTDDWLRSQTPEDIL